MHITVHGIPAPQGSKRHVGRGIMIESSKKVKPWREAIKSAILDADVEMITEPVTVVAHFMFPRPKSHYRTGRNSHLLRDNAPDRPGSRPDLDKLLRSTFDALTEAGAWRDDSQAVQILTNKLYSERPGAQLIVEPWSRMHLLSTAFDPTQAEPATRPHATDQRSA